MKINIKNTHLLLFLIVFLTSSVSAAKYTPYKIDDYNFLWHVVKIGNVTMDVNKTQNGEFINFASGYSLIQITPKEAVILSKILNDPKKYYNKMSDEGEMKIKQTSLMIRISETAHYDLILYIHKKDEYRSITLTQKEAIDISQYLKHAKQMIKQVNKKIKLTSRPQHKEDGTLLQSGHSQK